MENLSSLPSALLEDYDRWADHYWWTLHRAAASVDLTRRFLPANKLISRYLDIGCGPGSTTRMIAEGLRRQGSLTTDASVVGLDCDERLAILCQRNGVQLKLGNLEASALSGVSENGAFDLFSAMDVLEHLKDPEIFLRNLMPHLAPGALGVVTVPACPMLFSAWDTSVGHYRRYDKTLLSRLLIQSGYRLLWQSHLYSFALLPALLVRRFSRWPRVKLEREQEYLPRIPSWLNASLKIIGRLELSAMELSPIPFGTSLIAVIQKPAN
jgi:2-polyprenyl-3-methyl-5-hydroxy-6-metoxy-1,4-benzoquinol methylase